MYDENQVNPQYVDNGVFGCEYISNVNHSTIQGIHICLGHCALVAPKKLTSSLVLLGKLHKIMAHEMLRVRNSTDRKSTMFRNGN